MSAIVSAKKRIPIVEYWAEIGYPGQGLYAPPQPPEDTQLYENWKREHGELQKRAWRKLREAAAEGEIEIEAVRMVSKQDPNRTRYPLPESNVPEKIDKRWFERPDIELGPAEPVVIYFASVSNVLNGAWCDPWVLLGAPLATSYNRKRCLGWLCQERQKGPQGHRNKKHFERRAEERFGVSSGQFRGVWDEAATLVPNVAWGRPGPKRQSNK
jgi:hypothetical protein